MKVCHLISGDLWAGAEVQALGMMRALKNSSEIELQAVVLNQGELVERLRKIGVPVLVLDEAQLGFAQIKRQLRDYLRAYPAEILHSHRYKENLLGWLVKKPADVRRLVQTVHGVQERFSGLQSVKMLVNTRVNQFVSRRFDMILPVSEDIRRTLTARLGPVPMTTLHNAIDLDQVTPSRPRDAVRRELGIRPEQPLVGVIGRLVPIKGIDQFLHAAARVSAQLADCRFLVIGDGPQRAEYEVLNRELGLADVVRFTGFRADIPDLLSALDLFVISSHHEGISMVLLEAMALRRACVATSVGGTPEVLESGVSGVLVPAGNPEAAASTWLELLRDSTQRQRFGDAARTRVEAEFSLPTLQARLLSVYRELLESR